MDASDGSFAQSPGNALYPHHPPMRLPSLSFLYRLECLIAKEEFDIGAPHGGGMRRDVVNILGGSLRGPRLEGKVLPGGADWARTVQGTQVFIYHAVKEYINTKSVQSSTLDARYVVRTNDGHHLYIQAKGLYRPGPGTAYSEKVTSCPQQPPPTTVTQEDVEFFSHVTIEAGEGKYNWLNQLVVVGVLECVDDKVIYDAYYLTNYPEFRPEDVVASGSKRFGEQ